MLDRDEYYHVTQHVFDVLRENPFGYEVLLRHHTLTNPERLFEQAREQGKLVGLDILSIMKFLQSERPKNPEQKIFMNIFPSTLASQMVLEVFSWVQQHKIPNIVFELNESNEDETIWDSSTFLHHIQYAREAGIEIAVDDVGSGQATLSNISRIQPEYMKVDRYYGYHLAQSDEKKETVSTFIEFSAASKIHFVLEGVETKEDYEVAKQLGVPYMQGFYLDVPKPVRESIKE